ncbi:little elongation complex subunit 2 [Sphaeramia orbicularis]|uniref:Little elongation complex subunit 2 C-terminal domain-containing protein n=1 Tax=Sphaeramia orbicularis TaxID=375764 RepID=A0A673CKU2_9TELE|nr:little elongation complex subunit 2 [Sphaeramia orbicularis]
MELVWEDPPVPDAPFFTRDVYDKYSIAPNVRELWAFLQSPEDSANTEQDSGVVAANPNSISSEDKNAAFEARSCISKEESCWENCDSDDPCVDKGTEDCTDAKRSKQTLMCEGNTDFPEPRIPYPCLSSLSENQQKTYLGFLMSKKTMDCAQILQSRVNQEVKDFMMYLQDVSLICAEDYNFISQGPLQYSEDFMRSSLECIKTLPQVYKLNEMTSLTGGSFNPGLALTFEKQLLTMGSVDVTDHKIVPADAQLASDYQSVSSAIPPAKKAKDMHATISNDSNAERLCMHYEPHVCLTRDALVRLLDNHGPEFRDQWELPVVVKLHPGKGKGQQKAVYIDSPLLKTEVTVRERSHFYHEESLKLSIIRNGSRNVFHVRTERPVSEQQQQPTLEISQRNLPSIENDCLDFEVDLTDLETFGDTASNKTLKAPKIQDEQDSCDKSNKTATSQLGKTKGSIKLSTNTSCSLEAEKTTSLTYNDPITQETTQAVGHESSVPKSEQLREDTENDKGRHNTGDSDDEKLIIDDTPSPHQTPTAKHSKPEPGEKSADLPSTPVPKSNSADANLLSPSKVTKSRRQPKRAKISGDQLGEILRMQTAMFNSANEEAKTSNKTQESSCTGPSVHSHATSLVKPCVSSYLERSHSQDGETSGSNNKSAPVVDITSKEHKKILSEDLQAGAEDEQDYEAPKEGNLLYKLYSLQDLLLMVRSSISLTHTRKVGSSQNQHVPVHVLPKLEYQLCYGVECLSSSEVCQLWTETVLHSSTFSYIAHINAFTSKVALLRKLPDDWKQNISCGFKPSKSLNILHHLLKKLTGLEEGRYLIGHKAGEPFVTILKAINGKTKHEGYNLQKVHSSVPQPQASCSVPWIPVDPAVVLPFHLKHGRVPCTFPTKPFLKPKKDGGSQSNKNGAGSVNPGGGVSAKKKKKSRAAKRKKYIKKLVQKSF